jgi:hypothetical protein
MKIEQIKSQYLSAKAQIVLMDAECNLVETCHTLFAIPATPPTALPEAFPVLESLSPLLGKLPDVGDLVFPRVEFNVENTEYIADFVFFRNPENKQQIVWIIQDLTKQYNHFSNIQKERNELNIKNRRLEFQQEINAMQVELRYRQKVHQLQAEHMLNLSLLSENENFDFTNTLWMLIHTIAQPEYKDIPLKLHIGRDIPPILLGNQYNLCQILHNIITTVLRNTRQSELHLYVDRIDCRNNRVCLQFSIRNTDVLLPNYSQYIQNKDSHVSAQPHLHAHYMPLYIAQVLIMNNGGNFHSSPEDATQSHNYSFTILFDRALG